MESKRTLRYVATGLLLLAWMSRAVLADTIIYVDPEAPGANDGSSWEDAYICLQNALEGTVGAAEIRVAQGIYRPDQRTVLARAGDDRYIQSTRDLDETFRMRQGVVIKGGYAGYGHPRPDTRNVEAYPSILTGDLRGNDADLESLEWQSLTDFVTDPARNDNCHTVVTASSVTSSSVLDGFTITGGRGYGATVASTRTRTSPPVISDYPAVTPTTHGGGALIDTARPRFVQCTFYRNTTEAFNTGASGGAGAVCGDASPTFENCSFVENVAWAEGDEVWSYGAGLFCRSSDPALIDCTFTRNVAVGAERRCAGGAIACFASNPQLTGCSFVGNHAINSFGGAFYSRLLSAPTLTDCIFERNSAYAGGAFYGVDESTSSLTGCVFWANEAADVVTSDETDETSDDDPDDSDTSRTRGDEADPDEQDENAADGQGGALYSAASGLTTLARCRFLGNTAGAGGALSGAGEVTLINCVFSGNTAKLGGALDVHGDNGVTITDCTFATNQASQRGNTFYAWAQSVLEFSNCILWDEPPIDESSMSAEINIAYSNVRGGGFGQGSINADPRFQDPAGADELPGTPDDDLRLSVGSPCIDVGNQDLLPEGVTTDLAGQPRTAGPEIDMGAYEFDGPYNYYVDAINGDDEQEGYSPRQAFATIQRGIEAASNGYTVVVLPGIYTEEINFDGKAITVAGSQGGAILEAPGGYGVSFYTAERSTSILKNLAIQNCDVGIFIAGTSPTIQNVTLANNEFGIAAYAGAIPDISNCILWDNIDGDLFDCTATYSCIEQESEGEGNISVDPLFADSVGGDYHLLSERGRFVPGFGLWAFDAQTSPCVDAGDPWLDTGAERVPNGGRINLGAFGGTPQASLSEWPLPGDINHDGIVDGNDLDIINEHWQEELPGRAESTPTETNSLQPNPARWDIEGQPCEVHGGGNAFDYYVEMTATEVVSSAGPVEYFFECDQSDFSSGWQVERTYTVLVGRTGQGLRFRVRARDAIGNTTAWSEWARATMEGEN